MTTHEKYTAAVAEYLRRLRFNGLSAQTISNYEGTLNRFGSYLAEQDDADDLYAVVEQWRDELLENGAANSTVKAYLTNLKIFFGKACKRSFPSELRFPENPVDEDFMPKVSKKPYDEILSDEDIKKLWVNKPASRHQVHFWPRNYAIVTLILCTGLRNKEVLDLTLADVDFLHREITVRAGKGGKYRIVDAPDLALAAIEQYLDSGLRPAYLREDEPLFGTQAEHKFGVTKEAQNSEKWHRGTGRWLSELICVHVRTVCENPALCVRSHDLRHLFARLQLNASGNISELQAALGHSSPDITQIYAGRIQPHRRRDSAREVLAARDKAAQELRKQKTAEQKVVPLYA